MSRCVVQFVSYIYKLPVLAKASPSDLLNHSIYYIAVLYYLIFNLVVVPKVKKYTQILKIHQITSTHELVPAKKQSKFKYCQYLVLVFKNRNEVPPLRKGHGFVVLDL